VDQHIDTTPDELLLIIGKQQVILEKQAKALSDLTAAYNRQLEEIQNLRMTLQPKETEDGGLVKANIN